jgi:hypothetical protein
MLENNRRAFDACFGITRLRMTTNGRNKKVKEGRVERHESSALLRWFGYFLSEFKRSSMMLNTVPGPC